MSSDATEDLIDGAEPSPASAAVVLSPSLDTESTAPHPPGLQSGQTTSATSITLEESTENSVPVPPALSNSESDDPMQKAKLPVLVHLEASVDDAGPPLPLALHDQESRCLNEKTVKNIPNLSLEEVHSPQDFVEGSGQARLSPTEGCESVPIPENDNNDNQATDSNISDAEAEINDSEGIGHSVDRQRQPDIQIQDEENASEVMLIPEAFLVEEDPTLQGQVQTTQLEETPIIALRAEPMLPWWKQKNFQISVCAMVFLAAISVTLGVLLSSNMDSPNEVTSILVQTTVSLSVSPSQYPTYAPSYSTSPTIDPTTMPSLFPSEYPTDTPSSSSLPTAGPTAMPSLSPSQNPTDIPSSSTLPTTDPTTPPSASPSPTTSPTECVSQIYSSYQELNMDIFGLSYPVVAMDGGEAVVVTGTGYVVFFSLQENLWEMTQVFSVLNDVDNPILPSVSLSENEAVVGFPGATTDAGIQAGVIFFYEKDLTAGIWNEVQGPIAPENGGETAALFGISVGIDADLAVVAARQLFIDIYQRTGTLWQQVHRITPDICERLFPIVNMVDVIGTTVVISLWSRNCIYNYDQTTNTLESLQLISFDWPINAFASQLTERNYVFSEADVQDITTHEDNLLVAVNIYNRTGPNGNFSRHQVFNSSDFDPYFGSWLSIDEDILAVGGNDTLYIFTQNGGEWKETLRLETPNIVDTLQLLRINDRFAISGRQIFATSPNSVYYYNLEYCTQPMPTSSPTTSISPTGMPSFSPSIQISTTPSQTPTLSVIPSTNPSIQSSVAPSSSFSPSENPSMKPSGTPSRSFLPSLTFSPTSSLVPSHYPTSSPSTSPSQKPSISLSPSSSLSPSQQPSRSLFPSITSSPSNEPTYSQLPSTSLSPTTSCTSIYLARRQKLEIENFNLFHPTVSIDGNNLVVVTGSGHAVFFSLEDTTWVITQVFSARNEKDFPSLSSVTLNGKVTIVGYPLATTEAGLEAGVIYFYEQDRKSGVWYEAQGPVIPENGGQEGTWFGASVGVDGDLAVVGGRGDFNTGASVFLFRRSGDVWQEIYNSIPSEYFTVTFVTYVSVRGNTVAVSTLDVITIYSFDQASNTLVLKKSFQSNTCNDCYVELTQLSNKHLVYSTTKDHTQFATHMVLIYTYDDKRNSFNGPISFRASDYEEGFGLFLALEGGILTIGGNQSLFIFAQNEEEWEKIFRLDIPGAIDHHFFSFRQNRLAISGNQIIIPSADGFYSFNLSYCA